VASCPWGPWVPLPNILKKQIILSKASLTRFGVDIYLPPAPKCDPPNASRRPWDDPVLVTKTTSTASTARRPTGENETQKGGKGEIKRRVG